MREASKVIHVAPVATDTADCLPLHVRGALLLPSFTHWYRIKNVYAGKFPEGCTEDDFLSGILQRQPNDDLREWQEQVI